jgi:hypothetical protein
MTNNQETGQPTQNGKLTEIHSSSIDVPVQTHPDYKENSKDILEECGSLWRCVGTIELFLNDPIESEKSIMFDGKHLNRAQYLGYRNSDQKLEFVIKTKSWTDEGRRRGAAPDECFHQEIQPLLEYPIELIRKAILRFPDLHYELNKEAHERREAEEQFLNIAKELLEHDLPDEIVQKVGCLICGDATGEFRDNLGKRRFWNEGMCQHCQDKALAETSPNSN